MAYIFLDESGDLGFDFDRERTSKFFIMTFLYCENKRRIEKIVSLAHANLRKGHGVKEGVLHCYYEKPVTRRRLLGSLVKADCKIMTIRMNKRRMKIEVRLQGVALYGYIANCLLERLISRGIVGDGSKNLVLIASRRETSKYLNDRFKHDIRQRMAMNYGVKITVEIKTMYEEKGLQAVDFVSWAIFRKQEYGDASYYDLISNRIVENGILIL